MRWCYEEKFHVDQSPGVNKMYVTDLTNYKPQPKELVSSLLMQDPVDPPVDLAYVVANFLSQVIFMFLFFFNFIGNVSIHYHTQQQRKNNNEKINYNRHLMNVMQAVYSFTIFQSNWTFNPLSPSIKFQILLLCFHTFLTKVVGRSC